MQLAKPMLLLALGQSARAAYSTALWCGACVYIQDKCDTSSIPSAKMVNKVARRLRRTTSACAQAGSTSSSPCQCELYSCFDATQVTDPWCTAYSCNYVDKHMPCVGSGLKQVRLHGLAWYTRIHAQ